MHLRCASRPLRPLPCNSAARRASLPCLPLWTVGRPQPQRTPRLFSALTPTRAAHPLSHHYPAPAPPPPPHPAHAHPDTPHPPLPTPQGPCRRGGPKPPGWSRLCSSTMQGCGGACRPAGVDRPSGPTCGSCECLVALAQAVRAVTLFRSQECVVACASHASRVGVACLLESSACKWAGSACMQLHVLWSFAPPPWIALDAHVHSTTLAAGCAGVRHKH